MDKLKTCLALLFLFTFIIQVYGSFTVHFPSQDVVIPDELKVHFGDYWVKPTGCNMRIQAWFEQNWVNYTIDSSGVQEIHNGSCPVWALIDGVNKTEGDGWTYGTGTVTVTGATQGVNIYWGGAAAPPPDYPPANLQIGHNTTVASAPCLFYSEWEDDNGLSHFIFGCNVTGSWSNETAQTISGNPGWANQTKTLPAGGGVRVEYQFWVNDTADQWSTAEPFFLTTAAGSPYYSQVSSNETRQGKPCLFSCYWQDDVGLSHYVFGYNGTGSWVNTTGTLTGTGDWANESKTLPNNPGVTVGYRWWCNDTGDNWSNTPVYTLVTTEVTITQYIAASRPTTLYMRRDYTQANGVLGYTLAEENTDEERTSSVNVPGSVTVYWGWRVWLVESDLSQTELTDGTPEAQVNRSVDGEGIQTGLWLPSEELDLHVGWNCFKVALYMKMGTSNWYMKATFVTDLLLKKKLLKTTWIFKAYTKRETGSTTGTFYWGDTTDYNSRIENLEFEDPSVYETIMYYLESANFIQAILHPYTNLVGSMFYGFLILVLCVPIYVRYKTFTPILVLFIIFGGAGGILTLMMPIAGLQIAWVFLLFGLAGLLWRTFR